MIHWLESNALGTLFGFALWMIVLGPLWRKIAIWAREVRDLLDSTTPGGLGGLEQRLRAVERKLDDDS